MPAMPPLIVLAMCFGALASAATNVRDFGAKGDGVAKDTAAIQRAIDAAAGDAAAGQGGGTVLVTAGRYLSGTIHLKSNITLQLENGAILLASPDEADFDPYEKLPFESVSDKETTYFHYGLIVAEGVHDIAIEGKGVVDGNRTKRGGPKTIAIKLAEHVTIRGITVRNSPNYSISLWGTDYVDIDGVTILNGYADAIDPDSCRYVRIANCYIDAHDDAICPKASPSMGMDKRRPVEHLTVTNCVLRTDASHFKFGTESSGDLRHVTVTNCTMGPRGNGSRPRNGIAIESVDGANIDGVVISNIEMQGVTTPIFIRLGNRGRGLNPRVAGSVENISISNVVARNASMASSVTGLPGFPVRRVQLDGLMLGMVGGEREARGLDVPEQETAYPEGHMFGKLPGFGFYARHAEGLTLTNVQTRWETPDVRPAMVFDDVKDLVLDGFRTDTLATTAAALWLNDVAGAMIRGSRTAAARNFVQVRGAGSREIVLTGNDFTRMAEPVRLVGAAESAVTASGNIDKR
jgi:polygalacturonase